MGDRIRIRAAETGDVDAIARLLLPLSRKEIILPRSRDEIFEHLQEFLVAERGDQLAGTAALHIYGENLGEIRSLAVAPSLQGHGIGRALVQGCEAWAKALGLARLFALTYVPGFFERLGFRRIAKESLPHKVWTVCVHCPRFAHCDEVAVEKRLSEAPIRPMRLAPILEVEEGTGEGPGG